MTHRHPLALLGTASLALLVLHPAVRAQSLAMPSGPASLNGGLPPDDPNEVVVTATRVPSLADTVPAGVTVIDRDTIVERGYTTLVDALSAVPGLRIAQSGGLGGTASVFIRGTNSNDVLVLRDGVPINDPSDPDDAFNFGEDTLEDVERIEVVRGPMSGLYGTGAIGGVINIITRKGAGTPQGDLWLGGGAPRQGEVRGDLSGASGIWDYSGNIEANSLLGYDQTPERETGVYTGEPDGFRSKLATLDLGVTPVAGTRISLLIRGRDAKYGYDDLGYPAFDDPDETGYDSSLFGKLGVTSALFGGVWQTNLFVSGLQDDRRYTDLLDANDPNQSVGDSRYHARQADAQWDNTVHLPAWGPLTANSLTFGYEHTSDQAKLRVNTSTDGTFYGEDLDAHDDFDAGYAGVQATLLRRLHLTGQVREDATTIAGDAFTWRVGGVLDVPELASHLHATYGTGFRAPSLFDRYGIDSDGYVGNPDLRPEYSEGWEVGVTTDIPLAGRADYASVSVTYFHNRIRDLIDIEFSPVYTPVNVASARTEGVETALTLRPASWAEADLTYTYTDARDLSDDSLLLRRPLNQASADLRLRPMPGLVLAPEVLFTGSFMDDLVDDNGYPIGTGLSPSGVVVNFNVTYQATPHVMLFAYGKNINGSRWEPVNGYQIPGPSVLAGTRLSF